MSLWKPIRIPQGSCQATITRAAGVQVLGVAQQGGEKDSLILHQQVLNAIPWFERKLSSGLIPREVTLPLL